jgi:hypothetical protein
VLKLWRESKTLDALRQNRDSVHRCWNLWLEGLSNEERNVRLARLAGFMAFYERHAGNTMECFKNVDAQINLAEAAQRPQLNLAEIAHAKMKCLGGYGDTLDEAVLFDIVCGTRQVAAGELEQEGAQYHGKQLVFLSQCINHCMAVQKYWLCETLNSTSHEMYRIKNKTSYNNPHIG